MKRILFLDVDGVCNNHTFMDNMRKECIGGHSRGVYFGSRCDCHHIDPENVKHLNSILDAHPDTHIVLSSGWRTAETPLSMTMTLQCKGFRGTIRDSTPLHSDLERLAEIQDYWGSNDLPEDTAMVILDDLVPEEVASQPWAILTNAWKGLTAEDAQKAILGLNTPLTEATWQAFLVAAAGVGDEDHEPTD